MIYPQAKYWGMDSLPTDSLYEALSRQISGLWEFSLSINKEQVVCKGGNTLAVFCLRYPELM
jgi:hypothetical protein